MKQKRHSVDEIIPKLRRADVELGKGKKVPEVCQLIEITEQTYYRWRQGHRRKAVVAAAWLRRWRRSSKPCRNRMLG